MNKKHLLAVACCLPLGLMAQKGFTIKGKVGTLNAPAMVYLTYRQDTTLVKDSALLKKGEFAFKGKLQSPVQASLVVKHDTVTRAQRDGLYFYIENSNITVTAKDSIKNAIVKGSATNDEDAALRQAQQPFRNTADSLKKAYYAKTAEERKDSAWKAAVSRVMNESQTGYDGATKQFIATHPNSYIALRAFAEVEVGYNFNPDSAAVKFARFSPAIQSSVTGKKIAAMIEKGRQTDVGVMAMDFAQNDTTGKQVKLSDFRGKYVLVDFWASWCKPCRAENPNLLAAYNKFKDKNFTILGVSLDDEKGRRAWLGAVLKDNLPWTQVSELKGFESKAAVQYGINAIPANYLIDPKGKIIAKNLRGEDLEKKLGEILN